MCTTGQQSAPDSAADAVAMARAGLAWLADSDPSALTAAEQADCLRELERAESLHLAARASVLTAFATAGGFEDDGHGSARTWLKWQTQITGGAAASAIGWMRRLTAHPAVRDALAAATISASWSRHICDWTDLLPEAARADADVILLGAAVGGADLADLAGLAEEMRKRTARPDNDHGDGFDDRWLRIGLTFRGTGRLDAGLTPQCAAAVTAVLDALGKKAGPEDTRTRRQRDHDALEEAMRRLLAAGCIPDRAGQPTQIQLHMTLRQLRDLDTGHVGESAWAEQNAGPQDSELLTGPAAGPGASCDATIVPIVSGDIDHALLDELAAALLGSYGDAATGRPGPVPGREPGQNEDDLASDDLAGDDLAGDDLAGAARWERARGTVRMFGVRNAADLLSGPAGLAARLRTGLLTGPASSPSLPLDIGTASDTIPAHLRRAVIIRDRHCRFPGCDQPAAACQPHHIIPRAAGGPHRLTNLLLLCSFHHLIAVHRWGWAITLHPDATVTATSPDRARIFHSHSPPATAA